MKRSIALILCLLLAATAGCAAPVAAPVPTPAPTPEPVGMEKAFGKAVSVALYGGTDEGFCAGVQAQAELLGVPVTLVESPEAAAAYDLLIAYAAGGAPELSGIKIPVVCYAWDALPEGARGVVYDMDAEQQAALQAMFTYPSHEAPVRLLGLFSAPESEGLRLYTAMQAAGKLQSKGEYLQVSSDGAAPDAAGSDGALGWTLAALDGITVGVLDTLYTDSASLALPAFAALVQAARNDAVEVCTAGLNAQIVEAMIEDHFLMGTAAGANEYGAGKLAMRMAAFLLAGEPAEDITLEPLTVCAEDVLALYRAGTTDAYAILDALDTEGEALLRADFLTELAGDYGA